jgi:ribosome-binding protein aMBF1 (putative translation factor)
MSAPWLGIAQSNRSRIDVYTWILWTLHDADATLGRMPSKSFKKARKDSAREWFGSALRRARKESGLTQEALAHLADMHPTYIADIERGDRNLALDNAEALAAAVGLPLWKMLEPPEDEGGMDPLP